MSCVFKGRLGCIGRGSPQQNTSTRRHIHNGTFLGGKVEGGDGDCQKRVLIVGGPTAVGKSACASQLASIVNGEIVSADSIKIYKGLQIGSNKSTFLDRTIHNQIPVHLIDVAQPTQLFSMGDFARASRSAVKDIFSRGKQPIMCGGSSFYMQGFVRGAPLAPRRDDDVVTNLIELMKKDGNWEKSIQRLAELDPTEAEKINRETPMNYTRLIRALEINMTTGKTKSSFPLTADIIPYDIRAVCLYPSDRTQLYRTIDLRCEKMIKDGLLLESWRLLKTYPDLLKDLRPSQDVDIDIDLRNPIATAIGYRQSFDFLLHSPQYDLPSFSQFVQLYMNRSRQYARKQLTWFKNTNLFTTYFIQPDREAVVGKLMEVLKMDREQFEREARERKEMIEKQDQRIDRQMRTYSSVLHVFDPRTQEGKENIGGELKRLRGRVSEDGKWWLKSQSGRVLGGVIE